MKAELFLFRHGQTDWNKEGRIQGQLDVPLNEEGRRQARTLIEPLRRLGVEAVLSSDLSRAKETASIIAHGLGIPLFADRGIRETQLGDAQGLTKKELFEKYGEEFFSQLWTFPLSDADVVKLGSETGEQVLERCLDTFQKFTSHHGFRRIAVSTHGGVIRRLIQYALGEERLPPSIVNCALFQMGFEPKRRNLSFGNFTRFDAL